MILATATPLSLVLGLSAATGYTLAATIGQGRTARQRTLLLLALGAHALLLAWGLWAEPPQFGFAPALSVTAWLVMAAYAVESRVYPQLQAHWLLGALSGLAVLLGLAYPGQPLQASASGWLPLHWALGIASYGLFAAAVAHAVLMNRAEARIRQASPGAAGLPLLTLERLTFRFVTVGFALLSATLLVGVLFGESLYGTAGAAWRWDHKTVLSLLSWLTFGVLLFGRARFGWRGRRAAHILYTGAGFLLLAYVGSHFVFEIILRRNP